MTTWETQAVSVGSGERLVLSAGGCRAKKEKRGVFKTSLAPSDTRVKNASFPGVQRRPPRKDRTGGAVHNSIQENPRRGFPRGHFVWRGSPRILGVDQERATRRTCVFITWKELQPGDIACNEGNISGKFTKVLMR